MFVIRIIIATALLMASLACGVIGWAFYSSAKAVPLFFEAGISVNVEHAAGAGAVVLFVLAGIAIYPALKRKRRSAARRPVAAKDPTIEKARSAARSLTFRDKPAPPASGRANPEFDAVTRNDSAPGEPATAEPATAEPAKDEPAKAAPDPKVIDELHKRMARLVSIEQNEITSSVAIGLVHDYYPNLGSIVRRINDDRSLDTFTRHVVSIVRNQLKLADPRLSDNQFAIFQSKVFEEESEEILMMYAPDQAARLTPEQREHYGKAVDRRNWESLQRTLRGSSEDWKGFSIKNGERLLQQASALD